MSAPVTETVAGSDLARAHFLQRGRRFAVPIPDGLMAIVLALAASVDFLTPEQQAVVPAMFFVYREELIYLLFVEGGFLMMQGTLVDIATRLKKRPPLWLIPIIIAGVVIFSNEAMGIVRIAWERGMVVFIPLLISLGERGAVLWNMPNRSQIQKIAARALIGNRITTGLALFGLITIVMVIGVIFDLYEWTSLGSWPTFAAGAIYFGIAAFDDWRVRGKKFAEKPRVLFRFDPIGIDYLAPL